MPPYTFPLPETDENKRRCEIGRFISVWHRDGHEFIGIVRAVDFGKPGGVMLVTVEDANAD